MARLRAHFGRRSGQRQFAGAFVAIFGVLWLIIEPLGLFLPDTFDWGWGGYVALVVISGIAAAWVVRPRRDILRAPPPTNVVIAIRVGDVLDQTGNVIIGTNDAFDTDLDHGIISARSVQGQLLARVFRGDRSELDKQIGASLPGTGVADPGKSFGKQTRYPIGTVATVARGDARYFLTAFTRMSVTLPANVSSSIESLQVALARTWEAVNAAGQREPVHIPVMGSHLARLDISHTLLIQMIVLSFIAAKAGGRLTVWIHHTDENTVDMAMLAEWLRGLCSA